jgi:metallo-beta-lactamase family protein
LASDSGSPQLQLTFHGAAQTVTGSCMELTLGERRILVDCGLYQGSRTLETLNHGAFGFAVNSIDAVVLTHAHIDHCGLLPKLVAQGFKGAIWCTQGTSDLLEFMLADAGRIQEGEALRRNHRRDRAGETAFQPLYTEADALKAWRQSRGVGLGEWFEPAQGFRVRLWNAGHILGAASAEIEAGGVRLLCSGDIGPDNKEIEADPQSPSDLDYVVCESTYGNRTRDRYTIEQRRDLLEREVNAALARGGNLVIPVFALERTQELVLDLIRLAEANRIPGVPIFVDSPLASRATGVFARHADELEDMAGVDIVRHPSIHYVEDAQESMRLNQMSGAIILAASGMCEAGRIRHHLKHNLHRRESTVLFVGFQAAGSLGRVLVDGAQRVRISGEDITVRAQIHRIDSYSAHADAQELLRWVQGRLPIHGALFLSHGEPDAIAGLEALVQADEPALKIIAPHIGESFALAAGAPARRVQTARADIEGALGHDWQNDYAAFVANLKHGLGHIRSDKARRRAIAEMQAILRQAGADG